MLSPALLDSLESNGMYHRLKIKINNNELKTVLGSCGKKAN